MAMCGISPIIIDFFATSLSQSYVDLFLYNTCLGNIKIRKGIFQGDSVSPLHFVINLLPLSLLLNRENLGYQLKDSNDLHISHRLYMDDLTHEGPKSFARIIKIMARQTRNVYPWAFVC